VGDAGSARRLPAGCRRARGVVYPQAPETKVFCFFSSEKKIFLCFCASEPGCPA
jgi:hypothetical protein